MIFQHYIFTGECLPQIRSLLICNSLLHNIQIQQHIIIIPFSFKIHFCKIVFTEHSNL